MIRQARAELATDHGTVKLVAEQLDSRSEARRTSGTPPISSDALPFRSCSPAR